MRIKQFLLILTTLSISSCSKDESRLNSPQSSSLNTGTYKGSITVYINNNFHSTQIKNITLSAGTAPNQYNMVNDIFMSNTCLISSNAMTIPSDTLVFSPVFNVVEYGSGTFNGNDLTIDFHQDQVNPSTQAIMATGRWTGTLVKQ